MAEIDQAIVQHVEDHHLGKSKEEIQEAFKEHYSLLDNGRKLDMLIDDYFGEARVDIDGETFRSGGSRDHNIENWRDQKVFNSNVAAFNKKVEHQLDNGGVRAKIKLSKSQTIAVGVALAPIFAASIQALL